MKLKYSDKDQLKEGDTFFYAECSNPILSHQESGVHVYRVEVENLKLKTDLGRIYKETLMFQIKKVVAFAGKMSYSTGPQSNTFSSINNFLDFQHINSKNFYSKLEEAQREAIIMALEEYKPFTN